MSVQHTDSFTVGADILIGVYGDWVDRHTSSDDFEIKAANDYVDMDAATGNDIFSCWEGSGFSTTRQSRTRARRIPNKTVHRLLRKSRFASLLTNLG